MFRTDYKGAPLRCHLGLSRPKTPHFCHCLSFATIRIDQSPSLSPTPGRQRNTVETVQWQTEVVQRGRREIDDTARCRDDAAS